MGNVGYGIRIIGVCCGVYFSGLRKGDVWGKKEGKRGYGKMLISSSDLIEDWVVLLFLHRITIMRIVIVIVREW